MKKLLALAALVLAACSTAPVYAPPPHLQGVKVVSQCPPTMVQQARWLQANLARVSLGEDKLSTTAILGNPARAESFLLSDGNSIEVLFYHTASTVCRRPDVDASLLPFVFQNDRLLGYGQNYYHDFVVPNLRAPMRNTTPVARDNPPLNPLARAPSRTLTEDLPGSQPRVESLNRGKTMAPKTTTVPTSPKLDEEDLPQEPSDLVLDSSGLVAGEGDTQLGRGQPLPQNVAPKTH
jgi:hypothetical protein